MDRILAAAAGGYPHRLTRALFEALREFPLVQRATLWSAGIHGRPWRHVRTLGAPTPAPEEVSGPSWSAPGFTVLRAVPFGSLVLEMAPGNDNEDELLGIESLLTMCSSLASLEADDPQPALEDVRSALPSPLPSPLPPPIDAGPEKEFAPDGRGDGEQASEEDVSERQSNPRASQPETEALPDSGDTAA